jgi:hypothetical protein
LKQHQDEELSADEVYIRYAAVLHSSLGNIIHDEDEDADTKMPIYIIVCMSKESSQRLLDAPFIQSDIGFKRIVGFQEFELGGRDFTSRTSAQQLASFLSYIL